MRLVLTAMILSSSLFLFGQSKWEMIGEYKHSLFMYSYKLTLKDSNNYEIEESSDLGSERTIGTWTILGQAIRLTPKKRIRVDVYKKEVEKAITVSKEEVVVIETMNVLAVKDKDFKLERTK